MLVVACGREALAQEGPPLPRSGALPTTLPPPSDPTAVSATPLPPAPATTIVTSNTRLVDRHGPTFLAGFAFDGDASAWRLDALLPLRLPRAPALRAGIVFVYGHNGARLPSLEIDAHGFGVFGAASYDWKLPLRSKSGDFVVQADGGIGVGVARVKIDQAFMPGTFENYHAYAMRLGVAFQYRARAGWVISFQPFALIIPLTDVNDSIDNVRLDGVPIDVDIKSQAGYELALLAGYQL